MTTFPPRLFAALTLALALAVPGRAAETKEPPPRKPSFGALCAAAAKCDAAKVRALLAQGLDPNSGTCGWGYAATLDYYMHREAKCALAQTLEALLDAGLASYSCVLNEALHYPPNEEGRLQNLQLLLDYGVDTTVPFKCPEWGYEARSAERWAQEAGHSATIELVQRAAKTPPEVRKARWQRKRAKREAEALLAARLPDIEAALKDAEAAAAAGKSEEAFKAYGVALAACPAGTEKSFELKGKVLAYVKSLPAAPPLSEEARRHFDRALIFLKKAQELRDYESAVSEFDASLKLAPWWADSYFNLGLALAKTGDFPGAIANLKLYLAAAPDSPDAETVRKKILELEVEQEMAERR